MKSDTMRKLLAFLLLTIISFSGMTLAEGKDTLRIAVSILPQKFFAEQLYESPLNVYVIIGPGQSPATYEPSPKQLAELGKSDNYFTIGVPFEERLVQKLQASFSKISIRHSHRGIIFRLISEHSHEDGAECSHEGETLDPHVWLNPLLVKIIAHNMSNGHKVGDYDNTDSYKSMLKDFQVKMDSLDAYIARTLAPFKGQKLYVFHPSFGYFCDRYGLEQVAIETGGKEPSARQLAELISQAKEEKIKAVIIQSQFSKKTAEAIASEIGAEVIALDPLAYDYINNMKYMADTIAKALSK